MQPLSVCDCAGSPDTCGEGACDLFYWGDLMCRYFLYLSKFVFCTFIFFIQLLSVNIFSTQTITLTHDLVLDVVACYGLALANLVWWLSFSAHLSIGYL